MQIIHAMMQEQEHVVTATISIQHSLIDNLYQHALLTLQHGAHTIGFVKGGTPLSYLEATHKPVIHEHLKEFFFNHCVYSSLFKELIHKKIILIGEPLLKHIDFTQEKDAQFVFDLPIVRLNLKNEWKKLVFKAPARKNYKDLDRQVLTFAKEEERTAQSSNHDVIQAHDMVCFTVSLLDAAQKPLLYPYKDTLWLKIGDEEADAEARELFLGKRVGDAWITTSTILQKYMSAEFDTRYLFALEVIEHVPSTFFSFEQFKHHFKIKTAKEVHLKFIEIFSYRNDTSQRRETVEKFFKTLLYHYSFDVPEQLIVRQQRKVLELVQTNPDYPVYKAQSDFKQRVKQLAKKQLQESILIDTIAYQEDMQASYEDVVSYLNVLKRARTKEFIHFNIPQTRMNDQEMPISHEVLRHYCLREKTLNYIISYLTKKN